MEFLVEDIEVMEQTIQENGGKYLMRLPNTPVGASEIKFKDPNGVVFDIVTTHYADKAWGSNN